MYKRQAYYKIGQNNSPKAEMSEPLMGKKINFIMQRYGKF
nr:MAG TPA: hypothetical protein [Caudoviricetes sp.]